jgi:hypothetical protein
VTGRSLGPAFAQRIEDDFPVGAFGLGGENKTLPHPYTENPVQGSKVTDFFFNHCRAQLWLDATIFFVHFFCVQSIWALLVMTGRVIDQDKKLYPRIQDLYDIG